MTITSPLELSVSNRGIQRVARNRSISFNYRDIKLSASYILSCVDRLRVNDKFQTTRTTFWSRHDPSVQHDDGTTKPPDDEVTETVVTSPRYGRHLEMTVLVTPAAASSDGGNDKLHPSGNGISPECTSS